MHSIQHYEMTSFHLFILEIQSSSKHLLISSYVPGAWDTAVNPIIFPGAHSIEPTADTEPGITRVLTALWQL